MSVPAADIRSAFVLELGKAMQTLGVPAHRFEEALEEVCTALGIEGENASNVMTGAEFLNRINSGEKIDGRAVIVGRLSTTSVDRAREAIDMLKKKAGSAAIVLAYEDDGKVMLLAGVTDDLIGMGLKAGDLVKTIAPIVDGGGGGKPQMAQAGGKTPARIDEALAKAKELIKAGLGG